MSFHRGQWGWDPTDLWNVDDEIAEDLLLVLAFLRHRHEYPDEVGFGDQMQAVWERWRRGLV